MKIKLVNGAARIEVLAYSLPFLQNTKHTMDISVHLICIRILGSYQ